MRRRYQQFQRGRLTALELLVAAALTAIIPAPAQANAIFITFKAEPLAEALAADLVAFRCKWRAPETKYARNLNRLRAFYSGFRV